jgi:3-ketoacyl-CoA synthase
MKVIDFLFSCIGYYVTVWFVIFIYVYDGKYDDGFKEVFSNCTYHFLPFILIFFDFLMKCSNKKTVFLIDHVEFFPPPTWYVTVDQFLLKGKQSFNWSDDALKFQEKIIRSSGLGDTTSFPLTLHQSPPDLSLKACRSEFEQVVFPCIDSLKSQHPQLFGKIKYVIVNSSLLNPTPSWCSLILNHYKLGPNTETYNLGGMGCSASLISIHLAKKLLLGDSFMCCALIISTENITQSVYEGSDRSMLLSNALFRVGGAAILLSNCNPNNVAKYELLFTERTQTSGDDASYNCVMEELDEKGHHGIKIGQDLLVVAAKTIATHIQKIGRNILSYREQLKYVVHLVNAKQHPKQEEKTIPYIPDFHSWIQHFCIHAGGKKVIDSLQQSLNLSDVDIAASRATLYRMGNTSSSSIWYELHYLERPTWFEEQDKSKKTDDMKISSKTDDMKISGDSKVDPITTPTKITIPKPKPIVKGDKIWQLSFGSGFKCNSAVWKALKNITIPTSTTTVPNK